LARETEVKLRIADTKAFQRVLKKLGARTVGAGKGRVHEENVIFDTPQGGLAKHGQLLRIRTETQDVKGKPKKALPNKRVMLTFKRPVTRPASTETRRVAHSSRKVREEIEMEVTEAAKLKEILEGLGRSG